MCVGGGGGEAMEYGKEMGTESGGLGRELGVKGGGGVEGGWKRSNERFVFIYEVHGISDSHYNTLFSFTSV